MLQLCIFVVLVGVVCCVQSRQVSIQRKGVFDDEDDFFGGGFGNGMNGMGGGMSMMSSNFGGGGMGNFSSF